MQRTELDNEIKRAMKAQDKTRLSILRLVLNEVKNIEINERRETTEEDVVAMIKRVLKQTSETLEMSIKAGNNEERTSTLSAQCSMLEEYLPKQISGDELSALIDTVIAENGASTMKDMGSVMKELGVRTGGNFDKSGAAAMVKEKLS